jgi:hypothetical protein
LFYKVDISPETQIAFYQLQAHQGHGGIVINIVGLTRLDKMQFEDPTELAAGAIMDSDGLYVTDDDGIFVTEEE